MKKALVISFSDLTHDARVSRQVDFIKNDFQVTVAAYGAPEKRSYELLTIAKTKFTISHKLVTSFFLLTRWFTKAYRLLYQLDALQDVLTQRSFDLIIANDVESLPLAFNLKKNAKILFDAHEYAPRHFEDRLMWRIFFQPFNIYLCKTYIPKVDAMTTVGKGLALEYQKNFGVMPAIITNATWYSTLNPSEVIDGKIRLIHHGGSTPSRKLELMIEMMTHLDERFTLDLMLIVPHLASAKTANYINALKQLAANDKRIRFLPALKSSELVAFINQYDVGVFLLPPVNFNYANTLPNKLFDFIQARLAIAIGPTPEMAAIVNEYRIGIVSEDFSPRALATKLNAITSSQLREWKSNTRSSAQEFSAEKNDIALNKVIRAILSDTPTTPPRNEFD